MGDVQDQGSDGGAGFEDENIRLTLWIPKAWRRRLKVMAAQQEGATMSGLVTAALEKTYPDAPE